MYMIRSLEDFKGRKFYVSLIVTWGVTTLKSVVSSVIKHERDRRVLSMVTSREIPGTYIPVRTPNCTVCPW